MPIRITSTKNTRHDPARRGSTRAGSAAARRARINIGGRFIKPGKAGAILADAAALKFAATITEYAKAGVIHVRILPGSSLETVATFDPNSSIEKIVDVVTPIKLDDVEPMITLEVSATDTDFVNEAEEGVTTDEEVPPETTEVFVEAPKTPRKRRPTGAGRRRSNKE